MRLSDGRLPGLPLSLPSLQVQLQLSCRTSLLCCGRSAKCGHECRNHRKWVYDTVEQDGVPESTRENLHKPGKER